MKKLLISILLSTTGLTLEAMQQGGQPVQSKVPKLQALVEQEFIKKVVRGSLDLKELLETLQKLPETVRDSMQNAEFIASFAQKTPASQTNTLAGSITKFSDGSMRINDYLSIGDMIFLSDDLQHYLHINAQGNTVVNSLDKEHIKSTPSSLFAPEIHYYQFPQAIESQHYPYKIISSDADQESGPFLKILYPEDFEIEFKANSNEIIATSHVLSPSSLIISTEITQASKVQFDNIPLLLSLHKAITNLEINKLEKIIGIINLHPSDRKKIVDYVFITDNALQRAVKKGLSATGQQLEDAKTIIQILLDTGANLEQENVEGKTALKLAAPNPGLMATIQQAYARRVLFDAINLANKDKVNQVIVTIGKQGYTIPEFLNTSYGTDTPLVYTLTRALEATDKTQFDRYIAIAQLLITSGATFNNPSAERFLARYGKQYVKKIAPVLK